MSPVYTEGWFTPAVSRPLRLGKSGGKPPFPTCSILSFILLSAGLDKQAVWYLMLSSLQHFFNQITNPLCACVPCSRRNCSLTFTRERFVSFGQRFVNQLQKLFTTPGD